MKEHEDREILTEKEQQILDELEAGHYTSEKDYSSGGFYMCDNGEPGFNRIQLWYYEDDARSSGTEREVTVKVADVTFTYDPVNEEWSCDDMDEINEDIVDWLSNNIDTDAGDIEDQLRIQMRTLDDAKDMLLGYEYFDVNGTLYYYIPSDDEDDIELMEDDGSAEYDLQRELIEMKESATPLTIEEAAQMLLDGDYEWRDF